MIYDHIKYVLCAYEALRELGMFGKEKNER